ncbi:hypothetical protein L6452_23354 [Arctium lappa]|uniref:Uncharacterized protein n=1 Tax=Arctium lappa TaxID=4217 RepID=A0ACB9B2W1_ARCLA|nr:hypothetical protein L6452_23354 [Arctium lappa]
MKQTCISSPTQNKTTIIVTMQPPPPPPQVHLVIDPTTTTDRRRHGGIISTPIFKQTILPILSNFDAGYFRITLSLCFQTLLLKTLSHPPENPHPYRKLLAAIPSAALLLLWSISFLTLTSLSLLYLLRCALFSSMVKREYLNHIKVNYLFAPWISWLLLLQTSPFFKPQQNLCHLFLFWVFVVPIFVLDVKIYGQWFIKGKRFLSTVGNPASQLTVIGNFVGAGTAAEMGWKESGMVMFTVGIVHYVVVFVTLYQRLKGESCMPVMLRPVMFLFVGAPSMGSLAWDSINGSFDCSSKMLFYLALFLFFSLVSRPNLFKKSMRKFDVVWWAYSYPLTLLALASTEYAHEMKSSVAHLLMLILSALSVLVSCVLMVYTAFNTNILLPGDDDDVILITLKPIIISNTSSDSLTS